MLLAVRNCVLLNSLILAAAFAPPSSWTSKGHRLAVSSLLQRSNFFARHTKMNLFQNVANALKGGGGGAVSAPASPIFPETVSAPSWETLLSTAQATEVGKRLTVEKELREKGMGLTHTDNKVRLYGAKSESEIRVVLYRDSAAWCPYCQKVWLLLEEKQIPFRIEKINMRSYGDKPEWFLQKVPRGLLPAIELDGRFDRI
jgi:glutaredoxin